jgi:hypothetical protein
MTTTISTSVDAYLLGLVAIMTLIVLLVAREIAWGLPPERQIRWAKALNVGIVPLVITFGVILFLRLSPAFS